MLIDFSRSIFLLQNLKAERLARYEAFKAELRRLYQRLDVEPQTSFEAKMVCDDDEGLIMSTKNLALAESALDDLRKRYEENKRACVAAADRIAVLLRRLGMGQRHPESQAATTSYSLRAREEVGSPPSHRFKASLDMGCGFVLPCVHQLILPSFHLPVSPPEAL